MNPAYKFLKTLATMKGKSFIYAKQTHTVIDYMIDENFEKVTIKTSLTTFDRKYEQADEFLKYWQPAPAAVDSPSTSNLPANVPRVITQDDINHNNKMEAFIDQENSMANKLIAILEDNIAKVQKSKDYIPQANQINNNVNSIINIQKMKMDVMKQIKRR